MPVLTAASVLTYRAGKVRREIPDSRAAGLFLIVQTSGSKSWALRFRNLAGKPVKLTLGAVDFAGKETTDEPEIGAPLSLGQARQLTASIHRARARGEDVIADHKAAKERRQHAAAVAAADSFSAVAAAFFAEHKTKRSRVRPRRWRETATLLGLQYPLNADPSLVKPTIMPGSLAAAWATKPIATIDGHDIFRAVDDARRAGNDGRARHTYSTLSSLFSWALAKRKITANPAIGVSKPTPPPARERTLSDSEVAIFWRATDRLRPPERALLRMLLMTGARLREIGNMTRGELDGDTWTLPGTRSKNHRPLTLVLPPLAMRILDELPRSDDGAGFVFARRDGRVITDYSGLKARLDAEMTKLAGKPVTPWRVHDLRRTVASGMAALGIQLAVIEKVLNHVSGSFAGIVSVYQKHEFKAEKTAALLRWSQHIEGLTSGADNVVNLPGKRRRRP